MRGYERVRSNTNRSNAWMQAGENGGMDAARVYLSHCKFYGGISNNNVDKRISSVRGILGINYVDRRSSL